ncbi:MAG: GAF domain-containing protein [Myxococcota bacterium]|jgi:signal transduction protein with GAF and PtsI domain|nr:GAF domain-containing protein [Myxococcota bacterium]
MSAERKLNGLLNLTRRLRDEEKLDSILLAVVKAGMETVAADHCSVRILSRGEALLSAARSGDGIMHNPAPFSKGEGVLGWVVEMGLPTKVDDTALDPRFVEKDEQGFGIGSMLAAPILSAGRVIGVLSVAAKSAHCFSDDDVLLLELVANASASSIAAARVRRLTD